MKDSLFAARTVSVLFLALACTAVNVHAQKFVAESDADRTARHRSADWMALEGHLPDPATAAPADLLLAADVMRARRLPEDALEYYGFALQRGGDAGKLTNRMGITWLELRRPGLARAAFQTRGASRSEGRPGLE